jgi:hypothetical protein
LEAQLKQNGIRVYLILNAFWKPLERISGQFGP